MEPCAVEFLPAQFEILLRLYQLHLQIFLVLAVDRLRKLVLPSPSQSCSIDARMAISTVKSPLVDSTYILSRLEGLAAAILEAILDISLLGLIQVAQSEIGHVAVPLRVWRKDIV